MQTVKGNLYNIFLSFFKFKNSVYPSIKFTTFPPQPPMSEINVAAVLYPKPEKFEEVATLVTEVIKKVQANEPGTLIYYAISIQDKKEIVIVERYKDQAAVKAHMKSPYFREFSSKLAPLMAKPSEIRAGAFLNGSRGVSRL